MLLNAENTVFRSIFYQFGKVHNQKNTGKNAVDIA